MDILTIDCKRINSDNLFIKNNSVIFDKESAKKYFKNIPKVSAVTFLANSNFTYDKIINFDNLLAQESVDFVFETIVKKYGYNIWLLIADGSWQSNTRIVQYKKLWKRCPENWHVFTFENRSNEIIIKNNDQIKYAGILGVEKDDFLKSISIVRENSACALFASHTSSVDSIDINKLFEKAFPNVNESHINWLSFSLYLCDKNEIAIRLAGSLDEREASIDFILATSFYETITQRGKLG